MLTDDGSFMKKRNYRLMASLLKENLRWFLGAAILGIFSVFLGFFTPAVLAEVLDNYLQGLPSRLPGILAEWSQALGGREFMRNNLWIPGLAVVLISVLSGAFNFLKGSWTAIGA